MKIDINNHEFSIVWDGVYYKALENYPNISDWEMKSIIQFIEYEKKHNREVDFNIGNIELLNYINSQIDKVNKYKSIELPKIIRECTACKHSGCLTNYVCHTASLENANKIIMSNSLLSAKQINNKTKDELLSENRNAANDPYDYFDYVMFSWGNCQAGDRLVVERELNRLPTEEDLSENFKPGVRFYFNYSDLATHPNATFDGYHAIKIKDKLILNESIHLIIAPESYRDKLNISNNDKLLEKVHFIKHEGEDIWEWTKKVYNYISSI